MTILQTKTLTRQSISASLSSGCNVGATAPEEYGDYFACGETVPYYTNGYYWSSSLYESGSNNACCTSFDFINWNSGSDGRFRGLLVRPVCQ